MTAPPAELAAIERAMVTIRLRQQRRVIAEEARRQGISASAIASTELLDAVDDGAGSPRHAPSIDGFAATVSGVAQQLRMDQPRASRLVSAAITEGLLERSADQRDGRSSQLRLTAAGRGRLEEVHRHRRAVFARAMDNWTHEERAIFAALLTRFVDGLELGDAGPT